MSATAPLARRLGTFDAVVIGLGSMIGAGIFAAFTPAAAAAGAGLLLGLALAAIVAWCNATSSAQLAAAYPSSGGTYLYGRERLGPWAGYLAGWGFVVGKTASAAAMALTFAAYAVPAAWQRPVAMLAVVLLAAVNYRGITKTAGLTRILVVLVLLALAVAVAASWANPASSLGNVAGQDWLVHGWYGILQSAGLLFFAFAGYARIATLGEEVREPRRTIPRAIIIALSVAMAVYAVVAVTLLAALGPAALSTTAAPLVAAVASWPLAVPVVQVGAALAALGALLGLIAGLGRTALAMARERDLPPFLAAVHPRYKVPHRAEVIFALLICAVIAVADLRAVIGFSSFGVLLYYLVANVAAFTQPSEDRRYPKALQLFGAVACVLLVLTLPIESIAAGVAVFVVGIIVRAVRLWHDTRSSP